ncbi:MAG TPA: hypothetical protein VKQ07_03445, partial [Jatrophihabitantaceae bacterium]|nr:hypothetical protein [Jatrophihabitantaceae bacterium]
AELEVGSAELDVGSAELEVGSAELDVGSAELEVGSVLVGALLVAEELPPLSGEVLSTGGEVGADEDDDGELSGSSQLLAQIA